MNNLIYLASALLIIGGCKSKQQEQEIRSLSIKDSLLMRDSSKKGFRHHGLPKIYE